jgi:YesN/AraC family two-component response regulator
MCELIRHIFHESNSQRKYSSRVCENYMEILFSEVLRSYSKTCMHYDLDSGSRQTKMVAILEYMKNNYANLTLEKLAQFAGYDKAYLGKIIKKYTGLYYNDVINQYKLEHVKMYLESTECSIEKIAEVLGFSSATYLSTLFKKAYGCSPNKYRKGYKK